MEGYIYCSRKALPSAVGLRALRVGARFLQDFWAKVPRRAWHPGGYRTDEQRFSTRKTVKCRRACSIAPYSPWPFVSYHRLSLPAILHPQLRKTTALLRSLPTPPPLHPLPRPHYPPCCTGLPDAYAPVSSIQGTPPANMLLLSISGREAVQA